MSYSALCPVAEAVFATLVADATLAAALPGGVHGTIPQGVTYPFLWIEVLTEGDLRGFGTGEVPEVGFRTHVYSQYGSMSEAQEGNRLAKGLLKDATLTIAGYAQAGKATFRPPSVVLGDEAINGVRVHEIVSEYVVWCEVVP